MKLSKKSSKSSLFSGRKGKIVIQKTNLSQRKAIANFTVTYCKYAPTGGHFLPNPANSAADLHLFLFPMTILDRLDHWAKEVLDMDGDAALVVAVEQFYQKTVVHEQLKMYFVDANMDALKRHQVMRYVMLWYCR
jgi:hypothetical protein